MSRFRTGAVPERVVLLSARSIILRRIKIFFPLICLTLVPLLLGSWSPRKKFAAVMFHSNMSAFHDPLLNIRPFLDQNWAVRLFIPDCDRCHFEANKHALLRDRSVNLLQQAGIETTVFSHDVSDLPQGTTFDAKGSLDSGPILANHFALSKRVYDSIPEEKLLSFQEDVVFCSGSGRTLESFMQHRWLGAPWLVPKAFTGLLGTQINVLYGNGGAAVRSKKFILSCLKMKEYQDDVGRGLRGEGLPEDVFFSRCLFEHHKATTTIDEAISFAAEEIILPDFPSLVLHDPCRVANGPASVGCEHASSRANTEALLQTCPEAWRIVNRCVSSCVPQI